MDQTDYRQRDAASFLMLGTFFAVMGSLVLVDTASHRTSGALLVN